MERTLQVAESEATTTADIAKTANNGNDRARTGGPVSCFQKRKRVVSANAGSKSKPSS